MTSDISRRTLLTSVAGLAACSKMLRSPGEFLGSPLEYDRKWFVLHDAGRFLADARTYASKPGGVSSGNGLEDWRLRIGAFDATGSEVAPLDEGVSIPAEDLMGIGAVGLMATPFDVVQAGPKSAFLLQTACGGGLEVTRRTYSTKGNTGIDFVAGKLLRNPSVWPEGAEVEGLAPGRDARTGLWGYTDSHGEFRIPARYSKALTFHGGVARVADSKGLFGLINPKGELLVPHRYVFLSRTANGISAFHTSDSRGVVNTSDREQRAPGASEVVYDGGSYALVKVPTGFFSSRYLILAAKDGKHAELPETLNEAMVTSHGAIAREGRGRPWRLFGGDGKLLSNKTWPDALQSYRGLVQASDGELAGWIDGEGKWVVEPRYTTIQAFSYGWAECSRKGDKLSSMVNINGREILNGRILRGVSLGRVIATVEEPEPTRYQFVYYDTNGNKLRETPAANLAGPLR